MQTPSSFVSWRIAFITARPVGAPLVLTAGIVPQTPSSPSRTWQDQRSQPLSDGSSDTLRVEHIEYRLQWDDLGGIEQAFRILAMWPSIKAVRGLRGTNAILVLLLRVAEALVAAWDVNRMPADLSRFLRGVNEGEGLGEDRYLDGATVVRDNLEHWRSRFDRSLKESF